MRIPLPPRRLIPKWRQVASTLNITESRPTHEREPSEFTGNEVEFEKAVKLWRETKQSGVLGDVLSFSVHPELYDQAIRIGEEALKTGAKVTLAQKNLIHDIRDDPTIIEPGTRHPFERPIQKLRIILGNTPDNPLALMDYAQFQLAVGKQKAAQRALLTALNILPNNRIILRTMARFLVHVDKADHAHRLISRHALTPYDPWLMASEIALSSAAVAKSRFMMPGRQFIKTNPNINPKHITELTGAIAVEELHSGHMKRARESQLKALIAPNDNVIAQAVTCRDEFGIDYYSPVATLALQTSSEALTLQAMMDIKPEIMVQHAADWHTDEPFSSRPIQLLAMTYAYIGDFAKALQWAQAGLLANESDPGLLMTLAYIHAHNGDEKESFAVMHRLKQINAEYGPYCMATAGLIEYSKGHYDIGDALYGRAILDFNNKIKRPDLSTFCLVNQVFSAADYNHPESDKITASAQIAMQTHPSIDALLLLKTRSNNNLFEMQPEHKKLRRMSQWFFDPDLNTLFERRGLTAIGGQPLIILNKS